MVLSRKDMMAVKLPTADVDIPQLGGTVRLQAYSVLRRIDLAGAYSENLRAVKAWEDDQAKPEDEREGIEPVEQFDNMALQLLYAVSDGDGEFMFTVEDYDWFVANAPYNAILQLWEAYRTLNINEPTNEKVEEKKEPSDKTTNASSSFD